MQKGLRLLFLHFAFCILHSASANELTVDRTSLNADDTLTITVSLDGSFTSIDSVNVPLQNLKIVGAPAYSSQIAWVNGTLTQRKSYQYQARPLGPGNALVGPVVLETRDGQRDTLSPIAVQVLPDTTGGSNDPQQILRELLATHRDAFFIVCETDKKTAIVGEEVVATWTLYNGTSVEQWEIANVPRRDDFWSEQLGIGGERPETVMFGQVPLQKLVIMRLALFPLHSGPVTIGPLEVRAEVMRRNDFGGGFGMFEGSVVDITRHNAPVTIDVQPVPAGPPVDVVGDIAMHCGKATQANGGPVVMNVTLSGRANLRTAPVPWWAGTLDGSTQVEEGRLNVVRGADAATMTREWKLLVFPSRAGTFTLPPLATRPFSPTGGRQELRCNAQTLQVTAASHPERSRGTRRAARHLTPRSLDYARDDGDRDPRRNDFPRRPPHPPRFRPEKTRPRFPPPSGRSPRETARASRRKSSRRSVAFARTIRSGRRVSESALPPRFREY
jgi:hypothetical protein